MSHLQLGRALDYQHAIDSYASRNRDLHRYELSNDDWDSISMVTSWLKSFHTATTQMSTTKVPMLSTTHAIFRGLQDDIKDILRHLPAAVSPSLKSGLVDAHMKLSDYYHKYDESPFYTWAACKRLSHCFLYPLTDYFLVLDPRISYEGMKLDYASDPMLSEYLESSKKDLYAYYETHYANKHNPPSQVSAPQAVASSFTAPSHSPQKNFTARFHRKAATTLNELEEFFKLPPKDFETCNPIHWWMGRRAQFPNLFWFACDLLCIPGASLSQCQFIFTEASSGSAVAVEWVFSGGCDTISLRRASLHPETIKVLMLVKKKLHLVRAQCTAALHK